MSSSLSLVWTDEARDRLWEIEEFIARDSAERAARFVDTLIEHTEVTLPSNPQAGRIVPETDNPAIRELVFKGYRIIYHLNEDRIAVLSVFEGHRLLRESDIIAR
mgnify:CR=1 FL=1